ncbi:MAG: response regulator [Alphaproteobacteria bacterium]
MMHRIESEAARAAPMAAVARMRRPIAVVDDDADDRQALKRELQFLLGDLPVLPFHSGDALINFLQEHGNQSEKPGLILLDLRMAGIGGLRTLKYLHSHIALSDIPVMVISGSRDMLEISHALQYGARAVLQKPLSRYEFIKALQSLTPGDEETPPDQAE